MTASPLFVRSGPCPFCFKQDATHHVVEGGDGGHLSICQSCGEFVATKVSIALSVSADTFKSTFRDAVRASLACGEGKYPSVRTLDTLGFIEQLLALRRQGVSKQTTDAWLGEVCAEDEFAHLFASSEA